VLNEKPLLDRLREGSHWFFGVLLKHVGSLGSQKQDQRQKEKAHLVSPPLDRVLQVTNEKSFEECPSPAAREACGDGIQRSSRRVIDEHAPLGLPLHIWRDGKGGACSQKKCVTILN